MMNEDLINPLKQKAIYKFEQDKPYFSIEDESIITLTSEAEYADVLCEVKDANGNVCFQGVAEGIVKNQFILEFISKLIPLDVSGFLELVKQEEIKIAIAEYFKQLKNRNLKKGDSLEIQVGNDFYNIEIMHDLNVSERRHFRRQTNLQYNVSCEISSLMRFRENFNEAVMSLYKRFDIIMGNSWPKIGDQAIEKFFKTPWAQKNLADVEIKSIFELLIKESVVHGLGSVFLDNKDISPLSMLFQPISHETQVKNLLSCSRLSIDSWYYFGNMLKEKFDIPKDIEISLIEDIQDEALSGMRHQFVDAESTLEVLDFQKKLFIPQKDREQF